MRCDPSSVRVGWPERHSRSPGKGSGREPRIPIFPATLGQTPVGLRRSVDNSKCHGKRHPASPGRIQGQAEPVLQSSLQGTQPKASGGRSGGGRGGLRQCPEPAPDGDQPGLGNHVETAVPSLRRRDRLGNGQEPGGGRLYVGSRRRARRQLRAGNSEPDGFRPPERFQQLMRIAAQLGTRWASSSSPPAPWSGLRLHAATTSKPRSPVLEALLRFPIGIRPKAAQAGASKGRAEIGEPRCSER